LYRSSIPVGSWVTKSGKAREPPTLLLSLGQGVSPGFFCSRKGNILFDYIQKIPVVNREMYP